MRYSIAALSSSGLASLFSMLDSQKSFSLPGVCFITASSISVRVVLKRIISSGPGSKIGMYLPRTYAVATDFVVRKFTRDLFDESSDSPFRGNVCCDSLWNHCFMPCCRGNADDVAASSLLDHVRCTQLNCGKDSIELKDECESKFRLSYA